jgi:putative hydrolase of the HAD superfamily
LIKVIVFDLWNTLIPTTIDWPHLYSLIGKQHIRLGDFIARYERATQIKNYKDFEDFRKDFLKEFGPDSDLLEQELYEVYVNRLDKIYFFPEVVEVLKKLKKEGYKLALLSNTENIAFDKVEARLRLSEYFDFLGLSCNIKAVKPDAKMFDSIIKKFKVSSREVLMVGDSLRSDIAGAKSAGMHSAWINRKGKSFDFAKIKPEFELNTLKDIYKVVGVLNAKDD